MVKNKRERQESALFIAAKNGVLEIVMKILKDKPEAIVVYKTNSIGQNILHVAVINRQIHVLEYLMRQIKENLQEKLLRGVDSEGNTILHLAARLSHYMPMHVTGAAVHMQWEVKWFRYMNKKVPHKMQFLRNRSQQTPADIFATDHKDLIKEGVEWLKSTSESCSVVAALIAGVAFTTAITIPGGTEQVTGKPYLERHPAFKLFASTSLFAFCCSITSLILFLSILTSRQQPRDFHKDLPFKLLLGLSFLFMSIVSISVSFSAAFFFLLKDILKQDVFSLYVFTISSIYFTGVILLPLCTDLFKAVSIKIPQSGDIKSGGRLRI
ncbi:protein ACCELERATED CELL DEATH 6-like [Prosopis cineraria]|uniref:protein ACCELERATED CELL DEATH 6-like n=1 Tax=Prosopis cineraria TaxID=364024 RepID=UPI00240FC75D|nr:protein ACCELERATED CELL DEATH 6-like [Prosopis cineraria]